MQSNRIATAGLFISAVIGLIKLPCNAAPSPPGETRVIDNFEQLGIDTRKPRFGWIGTDPARGETISL